MTVGLYGVTYGNNTYVAVGNANNGNGAVFTSTNGSDWSFQNSGSSATFFDVTYANNFIASGHGGAIMSSSDGTSWASSDNVTSNELYGVTYGGHIYFGVGDNYTLIYSVDGTSWGNMGSSGNTSRAHIGASNVKHQATSVRAFGKSLGYLWLLPVSEKNATFISLLYLSYLPNLYSFLLYHLH